MVRSSVAEMAVEAVFRIPLGGLNHHSVPLGLGENRRGGDAGVLRVAFHDRLSRAGKPQGNPIAVDESAFGGMAQAADRPAHPLHRRPQDVELVDFFDGARLYAPNARFPKE